MREIAQFFTAILAVIVITKTWVDYRKNRESFRMFLFWTVTWALVAVVAFFPHVFDIVTDRFSSGKSGIGTFFGMALTFLLFIVYRVYVKMERIEREITRLIKDLALRKIK